MWRAHLFRKGLPLPSFHPLTLSISLPDEVQSPDERTRPTVNYQKISSEDLFHACAEKGEVAAWEEFVRRFHRLIATVALRTARQFGEASPQLVEEFVQEVYLKLCADNPRLLRTFHPMHPDAAYGFLKVLTMNLVRDRLKAARSEKRGGGEDCVSAEEIGNSRNAQSSKLSDAEVLERQVLIREIDLCLRTMDPAPTSERDRRIFWLYYRTGLTASAIATLPTIQLTTKGVESTLLRLTSQVRRRLLPFEGPLRGSQVKGFAPLNRSNKE